MERNRQEALERRARMQSQEPAAAQMAAEREIDKNAEQAGASTGDLQEQTNGTGIEAKHDSGLKILTASSKESPAPPASIVSNLLDELLARRSCAAAGEAVGKYELLDKALQHDGGADDLKEAMVSRLDDIIVSVVTMIVKMRTLRILRSPNLWLPKHARTSVFQTHVFIFCWRKHQ